MGLDLQTSLLSLQEDHCHTVSPMSTQARSTPSSISLSCEVVSSTLIQEEGKHQLPIYFTSRILHDAKKCYQMIEKVALALITSTRHLRPYFQSHQVIVKMNYPIKQVLQKPKLMRRMVAWSIKLSEFDL